MISNTKNDSEIYTLLSKKANSFCADCFDSCTLYVDMDNGVFLCQNCADIHKQLGFNVKSSVTDNFSSDEIQKLKQSDNDIFNNKWMALYQSNSTKIPFGASTQQRITFITNKYLHKKWFSQSSQNSNQSFYNRNRLDIQKVNDENDNSDGSLFESNSESFDTSEITSPNDQNYFGLYQKEREVVIPVCDELMNMDHPSKAKKKAKRKNQEEREEQLELSSVSPQPLQASINSYQLSRSLRDDRRALPTVTDYEDYVYNDNELCDFNSVNSVGEVCLFGEMNENDSQQNGRAQEKDSSKYRYFHKEAIKVRSSINWNKAKNYVCSAKFICVVVFVALLIILFCLFIYVY